MLLGPSLEHEHAIAHQHRLLDRMGHEDHAGRPRFPDAQQLELQDFPGLGIDRGERLVHQQHARLDRQRARQPAALLHATRHLIGIGLLEAAEPDQLDETRHPSPRARRPEAPAIRRP